MKTEDNTNMRTLPIATAVALTLATASTASAFHADGFCLKAVNVPAFAATGYAARQVVMIPGELGIVYALPAGTGNLTIVWKKAFDVGGKARTPNANVTQMNTIPTQIRSHQMSGPQFKRR
jgi:hypothetical protein